MIGKPIKPDLVVGQEYPNKDIWTKRVVTTYFDSNLYEREISYERDIDEDVINSIEKNVDLRKLDNLVVSYKKNKIFFPKGVEELDDALISQPLEWLKAYPNSEKAWSKTLREYAGSNGHNASDIADLTRKALESFFKEFFENNKTLENNKAEYGRYLKSQGVPAEISNNLETLLLAYTNYMNAYAKHHDKTEPKVLEYLLYQTGNIIRLLITIKHTENDL